ncbi:MAG: hypothetical protein ACE5ID_00775 [Acidobacteriota bacterium]
MGMRKRASPAAAPDGPGGDPMDNVPSRQGMTVYRVLRKMVDQLQARHAAGGSARARLQRLDLNLPLVLKGPDASPEQFARLLVRQIGEQLDLRVQESLAFRPGHAFCHHCAGRPSGCAHSQPPSSVHVLVGYSPTGTPVWLPFAQYCLEIRHSDVHRLYDSPPALITVVQDAGTLRARLLQAWRNPDYRLLGQLTAGYFRLSSGGAGRQVMAITLQVTGAGRQGGSLCLGLNLLGGLPGGEAAARLWEQQGEIPWQRPVQWARLALTSLGRAGNGSGRRRPPDEEIETRVAGILAGLARRLEQACRGRRRRTVHAQKRHTAGLRPTRQALADLVGAPVEALLLDSKSGTLVVLGGRGRTHFFALDGRQVSSVRYSREAITRKQKSGQWQAAGAEIVASLRRALADPQEEDAGRRGPGDG